MAGVGLIRELSNVKKTVHRRQTDNLPTHVKRHAYFEEHPLIEGRTNPLVLPRLGSKPARQAEAGCLSVLANRTNPGKKSAPGSHRLDSSCGQESTKAAHPQRVSAPHSLSFFLCALHFVAPAPLYLCSLSPSSIRTRAQH